MPPADHQSLCKCAGDSDASDESEGIVWELCLQGRCSWTCEVENGLGGWERRMGRSCMPAVTLRLALPLPLALLPLTLKHP